MNLGNIAAGGAQILLVRRIKQRQVFVEDICLLLFKHDSVLAQYLFPVLIVLPVLGYLVDEKQ